jgi:hypothetical protein
MAGTVDTTSLPGIVAATHEVLPSGFQHTFANFQWVSHFDWIAFGRFHNKFKTLITAWLSVYLLNDDSLSSYLTGAQHQQHLADGWYKEFRNNDGLVSEPDGTALTLSQ